MTSIVKVTQLHFFLIAVSYYNIRVYLVKVGRAAACAVGLYQAAGLQAERIYSLMADGSLNVRDKPSRDSAAGNTGLIGSGWSQHKYSVQEQIVTPLKCVRVRRSGVCCLLCVMWAHCLHAVELSERACACVRCGACLYVRACVDVNSRSFHLHALLLK